MTVPSRAMFLAIPLLLGALVGCATSRSPELPRLYETYPADRHQVPVILIPGMLGSRLVDRETGAEGWPGSTRKLLTSGYQELALQIDPATLEPLDDGLVPGGLFDSAVGQDYYVRIVNALQQSGGYRQAHPGQPATRGEARLYTFTYDWRQDMVRSAQKLDEMIEQIRRDYGDPDLRVDVVAHSMGAMIVRYYQRYGTADVLDSNAFPVTGAGARKLRRMALIGIPNLGSVSAIHYFINGYRVTLSRLLTEGVATMPAMYEFFPSRQVTWITTAWGEPLDFDAFDVSVWRNFGWSVFNHQVQRRMASHPEKWPPQDVFERYFEKHLMRAQRFAWSLMVPVGDVELVEPFLFGGDCVPTPARLVVEEVDGDAVARLIPEQILRPVPRIDYDKLMYEPGDGSVTRSSLLGRQEPDPSNPRHELATVEPDRALFYCEDHTALTGNRHFLGDLLHYLLSPD